MDRATTSAVPTTSHDLWARDPHKVCELQAFVKMCKQDPSILHTEEMCFLKEWVESMEGKILPATPKTKSQENIKKEKTDRRQRKT